MTDSNPTARRAEVVTPLFSEYRNSNRWAIIIGISEYKHRNWNLRYADRDAEEFYKLLQTDNGGGFSPDHIYKITNAEATTRNITKALRSFLQDPAREDLVIVYLACHGAPDPHRPENIYLLTHDTEPDDISGTALPMREINQALTENLLAEKVIILADTCHSAAIGSGIGRRGTHDEAALVYRYLQEVSNAKSGIALLTSAEATEPSFEDMKWGEGHGVFTYYLLQGMQGAADSDENGIVSVGELFEYVRDNVKLATNNKQHPSIGTNSFDRDLPIALNPKIRESRPSYHLQIKSFFGISFVALSTVLVGIAIYSFSQIEPNISVLREIIQPNLPSNFSDVVQAEPKASSKIIQSNPLFKSPGVVEVEPKASSGHLYLFDFRKIKSKMRPLLSLFSGGSIDQNDQNSFVLSILTRIILSFRRLLQPFSSFAK